MNRILHLNSKKAEKFSQNEKIENSLASERANIFSESIGNTNTNVDFSLKLDGSVSRQSIGLASGKKKILRA